MLGDSPNEVALEFIKPNDVFRGPAVVTVIQPDGIVTNHHHQSSSSSSSPIIITMP